LHPNILALLYSPLYLGWRLWLGPKANLTVERVRWVRTRRREEIEQHTSEA
jgi:cytochrome c-type biogenesis protein CcmH/NrfF